MKIYVSLNATTPQAVTTRLLVNTKLHTKFGKRLSGVVDTILAADPTARNGSFSYVDLLIRCLSRQFLPTTPILQKPLNQNCLRPNQPLSSGKCSS